MGTNLAERNAQAAGKSGQGILMAKRFRSSAHYTYRTVSAMREYPAVAPGSHAEMHFQVSSKTFIIQGGGSRCPLANQGNGDIFTRKSGPYSPRDDAVDSVGTDDVPSLIHGHVRSHFSGMRIHGQGSTSFVRKKLRTAFDRLLQEEGVEFIAADEYSDPVLFCYLDRAVLVVDPCSETFLFCNLRW